MRPAGWRAASVWPSGRWRERSWLARPSREPHPRRDIIRGCVRPDARGVRRRRRSRRCAAAVGDGGQQATGGHRVAARGGGAGRARCRRPGGEGVGVGAVAARSRPRGRARRPAARGRLRSPGRRAASISAARPEAAASSWTWPSRPKPVTSVRACAPAARACRAARAFSVVMTSIAARDQLRRGQAALQGGRDRARAERLGRARARRPAARRRWSASRAGRTDAGDREAVLGLGIVDRVAADDRGAGLGHRVRAAAQDLAQHLRPERLAAGRRRGSAR